VPAAFAASVSVGHFWSAAFAAALATVYSTPSARTVSPTFLSVAVTPLAVQSLGSKAGAGAV